MRNYRHRKPIARKHVRLVVTVRKRIRVWQAQEACRFSGRQQATLYGGLIHYQDSLSARSSTRRSQAASKPIEPNLGALNPGARTSIDRANSLTIVCLGREHLALMNRAHHFQQLCGLLLSVPFHAGGTRFDDVFKARLPGTWHRHVPPSPLQLQCGWKPPIGADDGFGMPLDVRSFPCCSERQGGFPAYRDDEQPRARLRDEARWQKATNGQSP